MRCSLCNSECVKDGQAPLETLEEHVMCCEEICLKDKYVCSNPGCISHTAEVCWNEYGECYYHLNHKPLPFIGGHTSAFGTIQRKVDVELDEKEDYDLFTFPCWPRKGWTLRVKWIRTADEEGNVLKKRRKYQWWTNENTLYISQMHMLFFSLREIRREKRNKLRYAKVLKEIEASANF